MADGIIGTARDIQRRNDEISWLEAENEKQVDEVFSHLGKLAENVVLPVGQRPYPDSLLSAEASLGCPIDARKRFASMCSQVIRLRDVCANYGEDRSVSIEGETIVLGASDWIGDSWESACAEIPLRWLESDARDISAMLERSRAEAEDESACAAQDRTRVKQEREREQLYEELRRKFESQANASAHTI